MFNQDFDPYDVLQKLSENQQNIALAINHHLESLKDHERRLDLNQQTINQILSSLQNQQKLIMGMFEMLTELQAVNNAKDST